MSSSKGFDPKQHLIKVTGGTDYLPVKWRLVWFRTEHPHGQIHTEVMEHDREAGYARVSAAVTYETVDEHGERVTALAEGTGTETKKDFAEYVEKAETKAIGRALAALGYGTQFADDFEGVVDAPVSRRQAAPASDSGSGSRVSGGGKNLLISDELATSLRQRITESGVEPEAVKAYLRDFYKVERIAELDQSKAQHLEHSLDDGSFQARLSGVDPAPAPEPEPEPETDDADADTDGETELSGEITDQAESRFVDRLAAAETTNELADLYNELIKEYDKEHRFPQQVRQKLRRVSEAQASAV